jgi:NitT/TauT family transport system substrate-binding protein
MSGGAAAAAVAGPLLGPGLARAASRARTASSLDTVSIVLDYLPNVDNIWIYLGLNKGYYAAKGIDLKVTVPTDFASTAVLVGLGTFDIGLGQMIGLLDPLLKGVPVVSIARLMAKDTEGVISLPKNNIRGPKDLVGKPFALPNDPATVAQFRQFMLSAGLSLDKVQLEYVDFSPPYIISGKAVAGDGVDWGEGVVVESETHQKPRILYYTDYGVPNNQGNIAFTSSKFAKANADILERFLEATALAIKELLTNPAAARQALEVASTGPNKLGTIQQNVASLNASRHSWFPNGSPSAAGQTYLVQDLDWWTTAYKWAKKIGYVSSYVDPTAVVTNKYITSSAASAAG